VTIEQAEATIYNLSTIYKHWWHMYSEEWYEAMNVIMRDRASA
jgi:hypothetical protein